MIQKTIDNLRERPKDERRAVAFGVSTAAVAVLFVGWLAVFIQSAQSSLSVEQVSSAYSAAAQAAQEVSENTAPQNSAVYGDTGLLQLIDEGANTPQQ